LIQTGERSSYADAMNFLMAICNHCCNTGCNCHES
jgi:hypothetical protein